MRLSLIAALLCLSFLTACNEEPSKPDSPEVRRAAIDAKAADDDSPDKRAETVMAAREFIARAFPDWQINGISRHRWQENIYIVYGDISKGDERRTIDVIVALFVDDNEHTYWKAEHNPSEGEQRIPGYVTRPYKQ